MTKIRCHREDTASTSTATVTERGQCCSKAVFSKRLHSFMLSMLLMFYVYVFGVVVAAFSVPSLSPLRQSRHRRFVVLRATSSATALEQQSDSAGTIQAGLFNVDLSDSLDDSEGKDAERQCSFPHSERQLKSIHSNAPAILLKSGPGTGKTYALASRTAHLIYSGECRPEQMVILSFTNRDAHTLKERAVTMYKQITGSDTNATVSPKEMMDRMWSGTIHAFASCIIRTYGRTSRRRHFRVVNSKEMRARVDKCLRILLEVSNYGTRGRPSIDKLKRIRLLHRDALTDVRQSRGFLLHQVCRCIDLWKESGILPPPAVNGHQMLPHNLGRKLVRDDCVELSMRLGISQNVALLAIELYPQYQMLHESHGTADPSDLAAIATHILTSNTKSLTAFRSKLKHVILDEYQDVSVTQHALIRVIIRGVIDESKDVHSFQNVGRTSLPPVLDRVNLPQNDANVCFQIPRLFCGGDSNQSIYGWRGAAPYISTEGFWRDYPQGIVVSLDKSFRLSHEMWKTANGLIDPDNKDKRKVKSCSANSECLPLFGSRDADEETLRGLISKASDKDDEHSSPIRIQGLWDAREEAKFIASTIRKRCKTRMKRCKAALGGLTSTQRDPSDVAVMVRSSKEMVLIREALTSIGIPFVVCASAEDVASQSRSHMNSNLKLMDMKPVVLMTMHRAKGTEFDDVYLAGWTEGKFPHPTSCSANRVNEERRLAFVAITRARQHVVITHSFMERVLHHGPDLASKYVTTQVSPSRFLYELVPAALISSADTVHNAKTTRADAIRGLPSVVWYRGKGIKECVAGRDVPAYFANSYSVEPSFRPAQPFDQSSISRGGISQETRPELRDIDITTVTVDGADDPVKIAQELGTNSLVDRLIPSDKELFDDAKNGLTACERNVRGLKGKYKTEFREVLRDRFGLKRGSALVLPKDTKIGVKDGKASFDVLLSIPKEKLKRKPLSTATAVELGRYICYLLLSGSSN